MDWRDLQVKPVLNRHRRTHIDNFTEGNKAWLLHLNPIDPKGKHLNGKGAVGIAMECFVVTGPEGDNLNLGTHRGARRVRDPEPYFAMVCLGKCGKGF